MVWHEEGYLSNEVGNSVVLLGNGLNRASSGPSWEDLLNALYNEVRPDPSVRPDSNKPFPLYYEELYLHGKRANSTTESELLQLVADHAKKIPTGDLLEAFASLPVRHVLTTNYDDATVLAGLKMSKDDGKNTAPVKETRYSLFRRREDGNNVVWQIHGSQNNPPSIMLGYEHYGAYLQNMRSYVTSSATYQDEPLPSLMKRLKEGETQIRSWVDFFFMKDVHILGLSLDFVEMHLWWLLTYRARKLSEGLSKFNGNIIYYCPRNSSLDEDPRRRRRLEMLHAAGVNVQQLGMRENDWAGFYANAIQEIADVTP